MAARNVIWVGELGREEPVVDTFELGRQLGAGIGLGILQYPEKRKALAELTYKIYSQLEPEQRKIVEAAPGFANWLILWQEAGFQPSGLKTPVAPVPTTGLEREQLRAQIERLKASTESERRAQELREKELALEEELARERLALQREGLKLREQELKAQLSLPKVEKVNAAIARITTRKQKYDDLYRRIFDPMTADEGQRGPLAASWLSGMLSLASQARKDPVLGKIQAHKDIIEEAVTKALVPEALPYFLENPPSRVGLERLINNWLRTAETPDEATMKAGILREYRPTFRKFDYDLVYDAKSHRLRIVPIPAARPEQQGFTERLKRALERVFSGFGGLD